MGIFDRFFRRDEKFNKQYPDASGTEGKRGKGTRPDGGKWWQVVVRLPGGLVIEENPYGKRRWKWRTQDGIRKKATEEDDDRDDN